MVKSAATAATQDELEAEFATLLTKATLSGRWSPVTSGQLGPEKKDDKYSIVSARKVSGDQWIISARIQYGQASMVMPVPVQVKWSGDTPILIVNNLSMGGDRTYTARVLIFDNTYSGSWNSSAGYGGLLYGTVNRDVEGMAKPAEAPATAPK